MPNPDIDKIKDIDAGEEYNIKNTWRPFKFFGADLSETPTTGPVFGIGVGQSMIATAQVFSPDEPVIFEIEPQPIPGEFTADAAAVSSGGIVDRGYVDLTRGTWLLIANCYFASNANGTRRADISPNSESTSGSVAYMQTPAADGTTTNYNICAIVNVTNLSARYYLVMQQSGGGSNLSIGGTITAHRLGEAYFS